jgi:tetratricopeptide (TPR) repeat protein
MVGGYFGLAQVAFAQRDYAGSAAALRGALRLQPNSATAYAKLGRIYTQTFQAQKAIAALRKALMLAPESEETHFYLGDLMLGLSRLDEAQYHLEQAIALDPGNAHFYARLGEVFLQRQQSAPNSARALAAYQQAIQINPRGAEAHYGLGRVYARQRRWREAAEELRSALSLDSSMGRAHYTLAQVCRHLGQPAEAAAQLEAFRRYRALRPSEGAEGGGRDSGGVGRQAKARKSAKG